MCLSACVHTHVYTMENVCMYGFACVERTCVYTHYIHTAPNAYQCLCLHAYAGQAYTPVTEEVTWWTPEAPTSATSCKSLYEALLFVLIFRQCINIV
jgi:hypothetical protein